VAAVLRRAQPRLAEQKVLRIGETEVDFRRLRAQQKGRNVQIEHDQVGRSFPAWPAAICNPWWPSVAVSTEYPSDPSLIAQGDDQARFIFDYEDVRHSSPLIDGVFTSCAGTPADTTGSQI
jgi:hypothetical protein